MKALIYILSFFIFLDIPVSSQTTVYKENLKWGIKEKESVIIPPVYDTLFNFDATGKVCLGCFKSKSSTSNKFIKMSSTNFNCNYLNRNHERLRIRNGKDTCTVFTLGKSTLKQYMEDSPYFIASVKGQKNLVTKDFKQLTRRGYYEISLSNVDGFYITQQVSEWDVVFTGLINSKEDEIVPYLYSAIKINSDDSLIIACSAGVRPNTEDDIYDYSGKKISGFGRHIETATKNFIIHRIYEPKDYYVLYNISTHEEKTLIADEVHAAPGDALRIRVKNEWFLYDLNTGLKKPTKQS